MKTTRLLLFRSEQRRIDAVHMDERTREWKSPCGAYMRSGYIGCLSLLLVLSLGCLLVSPVTARAADRVGARIAQSSATGSDGNVNLMLRGTSDKEKLKFAQEAADEIREGLSSLQKRIEEARSNKNIDLLNCLNEKYSSISALAKVTETATILMQEAITQNNSQQSEHQFRKIVIARFKAKQLLEQANECVGDDGTQGTSEDATVTVDSALVGGNTITDVPVDPIDAIDAGTEAGTLPEESP